MKLNQFFPDSSHTPIQRFVVLDRDLLSIKNACGAFLRETNGNPIVRQLSSTQAFVKIKARIRKPDSLSKLFNEGLMQHGNNIFERAMHGTSDLSQIHNYYLFIPDGYRFLYNGNCCETIQYGQALLTLADTNIASLLIKEQYQSGHLTTAMENRSDIMFYDIPFCYAVHKDSVDSYHTLITAITNITEN